MIKFTLSYEIVGSESGEALFAKQLRLRYLRYHKPYCNYNGFWVWNTLAVIWTSSTIAYRADYDDDTIPF